MSPRILVVDDDPGIQDVVRFALTGEGFDVEVVGDGESALAHATRGDYDVLVLDVMLPDLPGTGGLSPASHRRERGADPDADRVHAEVDSRPRPPARPRTMRSPALLPRQAASRMRSSCAAACPTGPTALVREIGGALRPDFGATRSLSTVRQPVEPNVFGVQLLLLPAERRASIFSSAPRPCAIPRQRRCRRRSTLLDVDVSIFLRKIRWSPGQREHVVTVRGASFSQRR